MIITSYASLADIEMNSMSALAADSGGQRFPLSQQFHNDIMELL
jgi:hypothetical protein